MRSVKPESANIQNVNAAIAKNNTTLQGMVNVAKLALI
jgi:hypothetical protein